MNYPGRNVFFCDGRLLMSYNNKPFLATVTIIVACTVLFGVFDCRYLAMNISIWIPIYVACLFIFVLIQLFKTALIDPGIIPRALNHDIMNIKDKPLQKFIEIIHVNGIQIRLKFCSTCCIYRPPRSSHCSICNNCVEKFDHHCPWVGNCIGRRNYRHFYCFICSLSLLIISELAFSIVHYVMETKTTGSFGMTVRQNPSTAFIISICFITMWSLLGLSIFHSYLIATNVTTNEDIKSSWYIRNRYQNPYDNGVISNCMSTLFSSKFPSLLNLRRVIGSDYDQFQSNNNFDSKQQLTEKDSLLRSNQPYENHERPQTFSIAMPISQSEISNNQSLNESNQEKQQINTTVVKMATKQHIDS